MSSYSLVRNSNPASTGHLLSGGRFKSNVEWVFGAFVAP